VQVRYGTSWQAKDGTWHKLDVEVSDQDLLNLESSAPVQKFLLLSKFAEFLVEVEKVRRDPKGMSPESKTRVEELKKDLNGHLA